MKKVAWIGAGVMGRSMAGHLQAKGFDVSVYARKPEVLETMKTQYGIEKCYSTIQEAVADAEVVFVMVGYPKDVEEVILGENGVFANVKPGTYVVDMTTSSPSLAVRLYEEGKKKGLHVMDAPVSGGDSGAKAGTLSIMVGGDEADFEAVMPMFQAFGKSINYMGPAGCWQINNMAPRALHGDHAPGFFIKHFVKDMRIVKEEAAAKGVDLEMLDSVLGLYEKMMERGYENDGTQALIKYYQN